MCVYCDNVTKNKKHKVCLTNFLFFFHSHLNIENITDADFAHTKRIYKNFEVKGEYHDLYVQSNKLLLAEVLRTFEICILKYIGLILQNYFQLPD